MTEIKRNRSPLRNMSWSADWLTFQKSLTVATFLGGFIIGVLTFLIQLDADKLKDIQGLIPFLPSLEDYKDLLIAIAGIAGTLLILSVFGIKMVIVDQVNPQKKFARVLLSSYELGLIAILILLPLIVIPFAQVGAVIMILIEAGLILMIGVYQFRKHSRSISLILRRIRRFFKREKG